MHFWKTCCYSDDNLFYYKRYLLKFVPRVLSSIANMYKRLPQGRQRFINKYLCFYEQTEV